MARQPSRGGARRPLWVGLGVAVVVVVTVASIVRAVQQPSHPPGPAPAPVVSTRAVALGDSVPYGHGLANPYPSPQIGLPAGAVSQGPSRLAYPSLVARDLALTMTVRPTN